MTALGPLLAFALIALAVIGRARSRARRQPAGLAALAPSSATTLAAPAAAIAPPPPQPAPAAPPLRRPAPAPPAAVPRLRVETLVGSAQSLTAAFVAAEILQPPVALRPEGFSPRAKS